VNPGDEFNHHQKQGIYNPVWPDSTPATAQAMRRTDHVTTLRSS
jgi:hypothetical protein